MPPFSFSCSLEPNPDTPTLWYTHRDSRAHRIYFRMKRCQFVPNGCRLASSMVPLCGNDRIGEWISKPKSLFPVSLLTTVALTRIDTAFTVAGAKEIVCNWLVVGSIAIFIAPNRQFGLSLNRWLFATVIRCAPTDDTGSTTCSRYEKSV